MVGGRVGEGSNAQQCHSLSIQSPARSGRAGLDGPVPPTQVAAAGAGEEQAAGSRQGCSSLWGIDPWENIPNDCFPLFPPHAELPASPP